VVSPTVGAWRTARERHQQRPDRLRRGVVGCELIVPLVAVDTRLDQTDRPQDGEVLAYCGLGALQQVREGRDAALACQERRQEV
jgi:hypothetical protein